MNPDVVATLVADDVSRELLVEAVRRATADDVRLAREIIDVRIAVNDARLAAIDARLDELAAAAEGRG